MYGQIAESTAVEALHLPMACKGPHNTNMSSGTAIHKGNMRREETPCAILPLGRILGFQCFHEFLRMEQGGEDTLKHGCSHVAPATRP